MKAPIIRKASSLADWQEQVKMWNTQPSEVIVEKEITLGSNDFDSLCKDFFEKKVT